MKRSPAGRIVPGLLMTAATAIPVVTTVEMITHVTPSATASGFSAASSGLASSASGSGGSTGSGSTSTAATPAPTAQPTQAATPTPPPAQPTATPTPKPQPSTPHTYVGVAAYDQFGTVQASITVSGTKITAVTIAAPMDDPRSAFINQQAVPLLQQETLQAQSARINLISGATETSQAYLQSLQNALSQAKLG